LIVQIGSLNATSICGHRAHITAPQLAHLECDFVRVSGAARAIIERRIWDAVQVKLDSNAKNQGWEGKPVPPLKGKLFDEYAHPLGATTVTKQGKRYRYYLSRAGDPESEMQARTDWKLPALDIERRVAEISKAMLANHTAIVEAAQVNVG